MGYTIVAVVGIALAYGVNYMMKYMHSANNWFAVGVLDCSIVVVGLWNHRIIISSYHHVIKMISLPPSLNQSFKSHSSPHRSFTHRLSYSSPSTQSLIPQSLNQSLIIYDWYKYIFCKIVVVVGTVIISWNHINRSFFQLKNCQCSFKQMMLMCDTTTLQYRRSTRTGNLNHFFACYSTLIFNLSS